MAQFTTVIFLKPDALSGRYSTVSPSRVHDFFYCLAGALDNTPFPKANLYDNTSYVAAEKAFRQIQERACSEEAFRSAIINKNITIGRLSSFGDTYKTYNDLVQIEAIVEQTIRLFGFQVQLKKPHILSMKDIDTIYREAIIFQPSLRNSLMNYLENKPILLLLLMGEQELSALQIIKTYVRYFFRYTYEEQHRLENLMHVPDLHDRLYLLELCTSS